MWNNCEEEGLDLFIDMLNLRDLTISEGDIASSSAVLRRP